MQKTKSSRLVGFGLMFVLFAVVPTIAQERQDLPNDERTPIEVSQPQDPHNLTVRENQRDSVLVKPLIAPTSKPKADLNKGKKEEETLSYNFLYYIIQKFKGADIVD